MKEGYRTGRSLSTGDVTKTSATLLEPHPAIGVPSHERNRDTPLDLDWVKDARVTLSAVERRSTSLTGRRTVKKQWQAAWLLKAVSCIDLTTLAGDDTVGKVRRLCAKARRPIRLDLLEAMGVADLGLTVRAVCVYPTMVPAAVQALLGSNIPVASVATGFPSGLSPMRLRLEEIRYAAAEGAAEIDIVITREHVLSSNWQALYDEGLQLRMPCGEE